MTYTKFFRQNEVTEIKTGGVKYYEETYDKFKYYAMLLKYGHCGAGYFIPILTTIKSKNPRAIKKSLDC